MRLMARLWGAGVSSVVFLVESLLSGGNGSRFCANAHLRGDETVAKMGSTWPVCVFFRFGSEGKQTVEEGAIAS
jgi:hypothetical protein